jgi:hypothetical protein
MRIQAEPLKAELDSVARILDRTGRLPPPPEALKGKSVAELLDNKTLNISVDHKFPQAIGIQHMLEKTAMFGNAVDINILCHLISVVTVTEGF